MRCLLVLSILGLITGCGGGGNDSPPVRSPGELVGVAHDAPLRNAAIKIYDWSSGSRGQLLAETDTDRLGNYSVSLTSSNRPILIVAGDSGSYKEEASGQSINLNPGQNISAVTNYESGESIDLQITPFTHLAQCYATFLVGEGTAVQDALNLANSKIAAIAGVEIIETKPLDVTDPNNSNVELTPGLKYGFLTAGISALMVDVAEDNGLPPHSEPFLTSIQFSKIACNDIKADGLLDGHGFIDATTTGQLSFGTYEITPITYRTLLAQRILTFTLSVENKTGLDIADLLVFANALSTNTDGVWAGEPGQPVDTEGPTIAPIIAENSYIGGTTSLGFTTTDPVGVPNVAFYVDDALVSTQDGSSPSLTLNTLSYFDGAHIVKVVATDAIGNETESLFIYNISNTGPAINMTSATVVGSTDYLAEGTWVSSGSSLTSITVEGVSATINLDGTWEASITLGSGFNVIDIIAIDELTNESTLTPTVGVDLNSPKYSHQNTTMKETTFEGQYNLCNSAELTVSTSSPICVRTDRVSLNGASINSSLDNLEFVYIHAIVQDSVGAGVFTNFDDLIVEYKYAKGGSLIVDWTVLTTGVKDGAPGSQLGDYFLPITTEFLGEDWFDTSVSEAHDIQIRITDLVGNTVTESYLLKFDVLPFNIDIVSSTNAAEIFDRPFATRTSVEGTTITNVASFTNNSGTPIFFDYTIGGNSGIVAKHEKVIRENSIRTVQTEQFRMKNSPVSAWRTIDSFRDYSSNSAYTTVSPTETKSAYFDITSDSYTVNDNTGWAGMPDFPCVASSSGGVIEIASLHEEERKKDYYNEGFFACIVNIIDVWNYWLWRDTEQNALQRRYTYSFENETGYPRNNVDIVSNIYEPVEQGVSVFNISLGSEVPRVGGLYEAPVGDSIEVRRNLYIPIMTHYNDIEVADLSIFSSYTSKYYDLDTTWGIDETIDFQLSASIGSTPLSQTVGSINNYTISR